MLVQVNTDGQTRSSAEWTATIQALVEDRLQRHSERITRVEVHLNDENTAAKAGGNDKRCLIEVRLAGLKPISTSAHADSHDLALDAAVSKMQKVIETTLGKLKSS